MSDSKLPNEKYSQRTNEHLENMAGCRKGASAWPLPSRAAKGTFLAARDCPSQGTVQPITTLAWLLAVGTSTTHIPRRCLNPSAWMPVPKGAVTLPELRDCQRHSLLPWLLLKCPRPLQPLEGLSLTPMPQVMGCYWPVTGAKEGQCTLGPEIANHPALQQAEGPFPRPLASCRAQL